MATKPFFCNMSMVYSVAKCELGDRKVDAIDILKFAKIYNVPVEFFFEGIEV